MAIETLDVDEIRRQMAQIRHELHEDVREVVAGAEAATDWHRYIRNFPWVAAGAAVALGYLIVPRRHRAVPSDLATQADVAQVRKAVAEGSRKKEAAPKERKGLVAMGLAMVGPVVLRAAQSYAAQYLETWIAQQQMMAAGPPPAGPGHAPGHPWTPGGPGRPPGGTPGF